MSETPITDGLAIEGSETWASVEYVLADHVQALERAANAMEEALDALRVDTDKAELWRAAENALAQYRRLKP